ncbi:hypothetical protein V8C86DRAFT_2473460 [Haematococcus lacustris]|nr:hypothetical protein QJQ45_022047 [Haematococcus lacustris]
MATRTVLVLVGIPGSGKSMVATDLAGAGWARLSRDDFFSEVAYIEAYKKLLRSSNDHIVVDRMNLSPKTRHLWVRLAREDMKASGRPTVVIALELLLHPEVCLARVKSRRGHPTISSYNSGGSSSDHARIIQSCHKKLVLVDAADEGFDAAYWVAEERSLPATVQMLCSEAATPTAPTAAASPPPKPWAQKHALLHCM